MTKCNDLFKNKLINNPTKTCQKVKTLLNNNDVYSRYILRTMKNIKGDVYLPVKEVYTKYKKTFLKGLKELDANNKRKCITCSKSMLKYGAKLKSCDGVTKFQIELKPKKIKPVFKIEKVNKPDTSKINKEYNDFANLEKKINFKSKTSKISNASLSTQLKNINNLENNINIIKELFKSEYKSKPLKALPAKNVSPIKKKKLNTEKIVSFKPSTKVEFNNLDPPLNVMKPSKFIRNKDEKISKKDVAKELEMLNEIKDYTHNKKKKKLLKSKKFKGMTETGDKLDAYKNYIVSETPINDDELYNKDPLNDDEEWKNKKPKKKIKFIDDDAKVDKDYVESSKVNYNARI